MKITVWTLQTRTRHGGAIRVLGSESDRAADTVRLALSSAKGAVRHVENKVAR